MKQIITFTDMIGNLPVEVHPYPAKKNLPQWYKDLPNYGENDKRPVVAHDGFATTTSTGKKCIPMLDALSSGYIIPCPMEIVVSIKNGQQYFQWPDWEAIGFHTPIQMSTHPYVKEYPHAAIPKFRSPWVIKTPKGYSTLFIPPMNRDEQIIKIFEGVVDTDTYHEGINFPFMIDPNWTGTIPLGYPLVQVIPFKRDSWEMKMGGDKEQTEVLETLRKLRLTFYNGYKDRFWSRKEYN